MLLAKLLQTERPIIVRDAGQDRLREILAIARESGEERREDEMSRKAMRAPIVFLRAVKK
jgi:hypothetical protein